MGRFAELLQPAPQRTRFSHLLESATPTLADDLSDALGPSRPSALVGAGQAALSGLSQLFGIPRMLPDWLSRQSAGRIFGTDVSRDAQGRELQHKPTSAEVGLDALIPPEVGDTTAPIPKAAAIVPVAWPLFGASLLGAAENAAMKAGLSKETAGLPREAFRRGAGLLLGLSTDPLSAAGGVAAGRALGLAPAALQRLALADQAMAAGGATLAGVGALEKGSEAVTKAGQGKYGEASLDALEAALGAGMAGLGAFGAAKIGAERRAGMAPTGEVYEFDPAASPAERAAAAARRQAAEAQAKAALEAELLGKQQAEAQAAAQAEAAANAAAAPRLAAWDQNVAALRAAGPEALLAELTGPRPGLDPLSRGPRQPLPGDPLAGTPVAADAPPLPAGAAPEGEPPIPAGHVRLYRGNPHYVTPEWIRGLPDERTTGRWFGFSREAVEPYARTFSEGDVVYVDVPESELATFQRGPLNPAEEVLPPRAVANRAVSLERPAPTPPEWAIPPEFRPPDILAPARAMAEQAQMGRDYTAARLAEELAGATEAPSPGGPLSAAVGGPIRVYHGTVETRYVPGVTAGGSSTAMAELQALAQRYGIKEWDSVAPVFERWARSPETSGGNNISAAEAARVRALANAAKSKVVAPPREELGFESFRMPTEAPELGVHLGTEQQARMFGTAFPFDLNISSPLRLPDLGVWSADRVLAAAKKAGVPITRAEEAAVAAAADKNAATRGLLQRKGYDSVVYRNEAEGAGDSYIAFDVGQIARPGPARLAAPAEAPPDIFAPARAMADQAQMGRDYTAARLAEELAGAPERGQRWAETAGGALREEGGGITPEAQFARDVRQAVSAAVGDPLEATMLGTRVPERGPVLASVGEDVRLSPAALRAAEAEGATGALIPKARVEASRKAVQAAILRKLDEALPPEPEAPAPAPKEKPVRPPQQPLQGPVRQAPVETPAAQQDRRFLRVIEPAFRSIERIPGVGRAMAGMGRAFQDLWERGAGAWTRDAAVAASGLGDSPEVVSKNFEGSAGVQKWLDGKGSFDAIPEALRPAAQRLRAVMDAARDEALALGVIKREELNPDGSYFPHVAKDQTVFSPEQKARDLAIREGLSLEEARAKLHGKSSQVVATRAGHKASAEHQRLDVLKEGEYRTDIGVIFEHLNEIARRVAEAKHLGPNGEKIHALIGRLPKDGRFSDQAFAQTFFDRLRGVEQQTRAHAASSAVRSYQAATGLVLSPFAQSTTLANTPAETSLGATARSLFDTFGRQVKDSAGNPISWGRPLRRMRAAFHDAKMEAEARGALFSSTAEKLAEHYTGGAAPGQSQLSGAAKRLPWLRGTEGVDAAQRVVAANTAKYVVPEAFAAAKRGDQVALRQLERWGIDPKAAELTPEMIDAAAKKISDRSQFKVGVGDLPLWASSPWGRVAFQFQSFMYQHSRFMGWAVKEAGKGNVKPLATMAVMGAGLGYMNQTIRTALKGYGIDSPDEQSFGKLLQEAASGRKHFAPTSPKGLALAAVEGLAAAGGVGILQSAVEKAGGDPINVLLGATGSDVMAAFRALPPIGAAIGAAGQGVVARATGDQTGAAAADKALEQASGKAGEAVTRLGAGLMPQIPVVLPANELAKELTAEQPPERPGWAGRMIDAARGKITPGQLLAGGLAGGEENLSQERRAAGTAARAGERARSATERLAGLVAPPSAKPGDKRAAESEKRALRAQFRLAYVEALRAGDAKAQGEVLRAAAQAGVPFSWSQIRGLRGLAYMDTEGVE